MVSRSHSGAVRKVLVTGHAGQAAYGHDIVCAAASALSETLVIGLTRVTHSAVDYDLTDGVMDLNLTADPSEAARAVLDTVCMGFKDLAESEPDFVRYREIVRD